MVRLPSANAYRGNLFENLRGELRRGCLAVREVLRKRRRVITSA